MSEFDAEELLCLFYYLVAPHRFFPDESQDVDIEKVFGEALNKLLSEGLGQLFNFQNPLLDVMENLAYLSYPAFCMLEYA